MNLISFLTIIADKTGSNILPPVFYFIGKHYPALFFYFIKRSYKKNAYATQSFDLDQNHFDTYKGQFETAFLGNSLLYWLTDFSELDSKKQQAILAYLECYQGPHRVHFFSDKPITAKIPAIELKNEIDYEMYSKLFLLLFPENASKAKSAVIYTVFKKYKLLSLEQACLLMNYAIVLSSKIDYAVEELFEALIIPEKSLFMLSSSFFAKHDKEFFNRWQAIKNDYSPVFWTTFWSEQLFRAYCFIELMQKKDFTQAKKSAYRLPFSFTQKDWKNISLPALKDAHDHMVTIDSNIKNGLSSHFEYFYLNFFVH